MLATSTPLDHSCTVALAWAPEPLSTGLKTLETASPLLPATPERPVSWPEASTGAAKAGGASGLAASAALTVRRVWALPEVLPARSVCCTDTR